MVREDTKHGRMKMVKWFAILKAHNVELKITEVSDEEAADEEA